MIELIFVIVIIGILAAVAIPKLAATRDDAKRVKALQNLATCVGDIGSAYTARGVEDNSSVACESVAKENCFIISDINLTANSADGNFTVKNNTSNTQAWCVAAQQDAKDQNLSNDSGYVHSFGGSHIKFD
ncbi:type II secretion system protein [Nitratifractor sp.]